MTQLRHLKPAKTVLLTGAGFTQSFGGYLTGQMWAQIFNQPEIQKLPRIRNTMLKDFNYESVYSSVIESGQYTREKRIAFTTAIRRAYQKMHDEILSEKIALLQSAVPTCTCIIKRLAESVHGTMFLFTLNQDLFIERYYQDVSPPYKVSMPGIKRGLRWFNPASGPWIYGDIQLPKNEEVRRIIEATGTEEHVNLMYMKLHGSAYWKSSISRAHGEDVMVIGNAKSKLIAKEPLLKWYFEVFKKVISQAENLLVIGYGFRDQHINEIILGNRGLKVHVVCPVEPGLFRQKLMELSPTRDSGKKIWNQLAGYYQGEVKDLWEDPEDLTEEGKSLFRNLEVQNVNATS